MRDVVSEPCMLRDDWKQAQGHESSAAHVSWAKPHCIRAPETQAASDSLYQIHTVAVSCFGGNHRWRAQARLVDIGEQLALGHARVADEEDVDHVAGLHARLHTRALSQPGLMKGSKPGMHIWSAADTDTYDALTQPCLDVKDCAGCKVCLKIC